jgi:transposase-like protein
MGLTPTRFKWRRAFERGELVDSATPSTALLPVRIGSLSEVERAESVAEQQPVTLGSIHIEFPVRAMISVESGADPALLRSIPEPAQVIELRTGTKICLAAGVTDMRRGV